MSKKILTDVKYSYARNPQAKTATSRQKRRRGMLTIKCVCGAKVLVVPDLKAMNRAIEKHVEQHDKHDKGFGKQDAVMKDLKQFLIEQTLAAASETG